MTMSIASHTVPIAADNPFNTNVFLVTLTCAPRSICMEKCCSKLFCSKLISLIIYGGIQRVFDRSVIIVSFFHERNFHSLNDILVRRNNAIHHSNIEHSFGRQFE